MKILVTGANGFLGSWVTRRLVDEGHEVSVLLRKQSDQSQIADLQVKKLWGDVTDLASLQESLTGQQAVFHLAGVIAYSKKDRPLMEKVNVQGTANVLRAMVDKQVGELLNLSSVAAIGAGMSPHEILNENSEFNLAHLNLGYFETKRKAEALIVAAVRKHGLRAITVNPSTIYGAGDARKGSRSTQLKVAQGKGLFYPQGGVSIIAVEDVVDGILAAFQKGKSGERYILSGDNLYLKDVFKLIAQFANSKAPFVPIPSVFMRGLAHLDEWLNAIGLNGPISSERAYVVSLFHWFDHSKATSIFGLNPKPAHFAIENSIRWARDQKLI